MKKLICFFLDHNVGWSRDYKEMWQLNCTRCGQTYMSEEESIVDKQRKMTSEESRNQIAFMQGMIAGTGLSLIAVVIKCLLK